METELSMTVSEYIAGAPAPQRKALKALRAAIKRAVPGVTERISYRIPVFELDGKYLLYIAQFKEHVSVYPVTAAMTKKHGKSIARYRHGRGTLRFSLDETLPVALVEKLAKVRAAERRAAPARR
jgi:uncharacterized protein YdhG (YjbR/CyaY superfamily)